MPEDTPFFDLQRALTTNPAFHNEMKQLMLKAAEAYDAGKHDEATKYMDEIARKCDFNPSLLLPYFFPRFADEKPMTLWNYPHAFSMMSIVPNGSITIQASRQVGKCVTGNTKVTGKDRYGNVKKLTMRQMFETAKMRDL